MALTENEWDELESIREKIKKLKSERNALVSSCGVKGAKVTGMPRSGCRSDITQNIGLKLVSYDDKIDRHKQRVKEILSYSDLPFAVYQMIIEYIVRGSTWDAIAEIWGRDRSYPRKKVMQYIIPSGRK